MEMITGRQPPNYSFWDFVGLEPSVWSPCRRQSNALAGHTTWLSGEGTSSAILFEDGQVVYTANAFDSRLWGDCAPLGSRPTKSEKKWWEVDCYNFVQNFARQALSVWQIISPGACKIYKSAILQLYYHYYDHQSIMLRKSKTKIPWDYAPNHRRVWDLQL